LLIGGATTSRIHTAVKIAPQYSHPAIHVTDASRAVGVVGSLLDKDTSRRTDYLEEVKELYDSIREDHYAAILDKKYLSLAASREKKIAIDFKSQPAPTKPSFLGSKAFNVRVVSKKKKFFFFKNVFENIWLTQLLW